jgi:hypothetical protein
MSALSWAIIILIVTLVLHLIEEVQTGFRVKFPIGEIPRPVFVGLNIVVYTFYATVLYMSITDHSLAVPLAWVFAVAMLINGAGHLGMMALRRGYFPGGLTAVLLLVGSVYLIYRLVA